jgi:signal transduction histidine kinase
MHQTLRADFVYVRLPAAKEAGTIFEAAWTELGVADTRAAADLGRWLSGWTGNADMKLSRIGGPFSDAPVNVAIASLGYVSGQSGMVAAGMNRSDFPSDYDRLLIRIGTNQLVIAVQAAETQAARSELAAHKERQRLARELHDSVTQALYGIALAAQTALELLPPGPTSMQEPLEYVQKLARGSLAEMRALIFDLRPESLTNEGLVMALARQSNAIRARHQIAVDERLPAEPDAPIEAKQALYGIAREALNNISKHSGARNVQLHLLVESDLITLVISDDGAGFNSAKDFPGHLGLQGMRERALEVGGELVISSASGSGTTITAKVPTTAR